MLALAHSKIPCVVLQVLGPRWKQLLSPWLLKTYCLLRREQTHPCPGWGVLLLRNPLALHPGCSSPFPAPCAGAAGLAVVLGWLLVFRKWYFLVSFPEQFTWLALVSEVAPLSFGGLFIAAVKLVRENRHKAERWLQEKTQDGSVRNPALVLKVAQEPSPGCMCPRIIPRHV